MYISCRTISLWYGWNTFEMISCYIFDSFHDKQTNKRFQLQLCVQSKVYHARLLGLPIGSMDICYYNIQYNGNL